MREGGIDFGDELSSYTMISIDDAAGEIQEEDEESLFQRLMVQTEGELSIEGEMVKGGISYPAKADLQVVLQKLNK